METAILGMPMTFDAKAGGDARATIRFRVSGDDGGDFRLRVADGAQALLGGQFSIEGDSTLPLRLAQWSPSRH